MEGADKATIKNYLNTLNCIEGLAMCLDDNAKEHENMLCENNMDDAIGHSILKCRAGNVDLKTRLNGIKKHAAEWKNDIRLGIGCRTHPNEKRNERHG